MRIRSASVGLVALLVASLAFAAAPKPRIVETTAPAYPEVSRRAQEHGDVLVRTAEGEVDGVVVHHCQGADARGAEVEGHDRSQATRTDHQHMGVQPARLGFHAQLGQQDVAGVAQQLIVVHG